MRKFSGILLFVLLCSFLSVAASALAADKPIEINISHIVAEDHTWHKASLKFKEQVESESGGRLKVNIYPNSQLGNEMDAINSIMTDGGTHIVFTGESMASIVPEMGIVGIPYLCETPEDINRLAAGPIGKKLAALLEEHANITVLGHFERGARELTSNKPIKTPDDIKGFIIRVPASPIHVAAWEAVGAKPTPMAFAEVFTSLQQHTIDGQENPLAMIKTGTFQEVQKYLNRTDHLRSFVYIAMSKSHLDDMPEDLRNIVLKAGADMQSYEHGLFTEDEVSLETFLKNAGMTFVEDVDKAAFAKLMSEGVERVLQGNDNYKNSVWPLYREFKGEK
jgi:tripartite ATP-independent transporter DctP family solute receptor